MTIPDQARWVGSASRQAVLTVPLRDLHRAVLRRFLDTSTAPTLDWMRQAATELGLDDSAIAELKTADLVHSDGRVVTAGHGCRDGARRQEMNKIGGQVVVLGESMSGLLAARVLADAYDRSRWSSVTCCQRRGCLAPGGVLRPVSTAGHGRAAGTNRTMDH